MSAIIQRLTELNKLDITLPISKEAIQINKINLELQSKFEDFARDVRNEITASTQYIEFINKHIRKETSGNIHYLDKLFVLLQWFNDLKKEESIECEISEIEIPDFIINLNGEDLVFKFELPTIVKELAYLKYILDTKKDDMKATDVLFYFTFRFINSINIGEETLKAEDIESSESVYNLLSMGKITSITDHIDEVLKPIQPVRNLEVDPRVFFA
tara:strand:+ start:1818 stop:2462 length:645 start_codon:yes stop_codon:yes gene_type:complete